MALFLQHCICKIDFYIKYLFINVALLLLLISYLHLLITKTQMTSILLCTINHEL